VPFSVWLFVPAVPRLPTHNCICIMDKGGRPCGKSAATLKRERTFWGGYAHLVCNSRVHKFFLFLHIYIYIYIYEHAHILPGLRRAFLVTFLNWFHPSLFDALVTRRDGKCRSLAPSLSLVTFSLLLSLSLSLSLLFSLCACTEAASGATVLATLSPAVATNTTFHRQNLSVLPERACGAV
jgi:hypothetical protein